ncbi:MAG TPA: class I SAM-dependent methyltransferase [Candidatus Angelobacter sp.]|jgi:methyltransferase (TIGR00027 family)|nr:class I SAM-dependent methyltransferase [Candidatus Angelobacter sp.]
MPDLPIRSVSDTALWVAYYRAMESERPDAHFHDPYARRLAGERGERIVKALRQGKAMSWVMILRTVCIDELVSRLVSQGIDTVINLAAGLDTRPYRMHLPASLHWIEVDLPEMVAYKQQHLEKESARCRLERISLDLANVEGRRQLFDRINSSAAKVVVISEGLLAYLQPEAVAGLAQDLHQQPKFQYWITDLASPAILERTQKHWGKQLSAANAPMHFAPAEGPEFFRPLGWNLAEFREFLDESRRLKREMPMAWMVRATERLFPKRFAKLRQKWRSGVILMERA